MKQSELYKHFEKINSWLLGLAQHNLAQEKLTNVKTLINLVEDLSNLFDIMRPFTLDYNKDEEPSPTE